MKILVAGSTGALGYPVCERLAAAGHAVTGLTRSPAKAPQLEAIGVRPLICDVYDASALRRKVQALQPEVVVHQLTDLPYGLPAAEMEAARIRNNRIRVEGTRNLIAALAGIPVRYFLAQSIAFQYADGPLPHREEDRLASPDLDTFEASVRGSGYRHAILRYGRLYGERTGVATVTAPCRLDAVRAAAATLRCLELRLEGTFNICEDGAYADPERFRAAAGWRP